MPGLPYFKSFFLIIIPFLVLLVASFIYYLVKNFFNPKKKLKTGSLFIAMVLGMIACALGGLFSEDYTFVHALCAFAVVFVCYLIYFILINGCLDDLKDYIYKIIVTICILAMVETVVYYLPINSDFVARIFDKHMNIGWAMTNSIATIYSIAIPIILYHSIKAKNPAFDYVLIFFICVFLLFTLSRTALLFAGILLPLAFVYTFIKTPHKKASIIAICVSAAALLVLYLIFREDLNKILGVMFERGTDLRGRAEIWEYCINEFKKMPAFGLSFFGEDMSGFWYPTRVIHNTLLQILCCTGVVGFVLFVPYFVKRYELLIRKFSLFKVFALFAVLLWELGGLFDLNFIRIFQLIIIFIIMAACENETTPEDFRLTFKTKSDKMKKQRKENV